MLGALAALGSALCWSISAILFRLAGATLSALALNFFKGLVALVCLLFLFDPSFIHETSVQIHSLLAASGVLGIAIGDTLYIAAIKRLGARFTLLIGALIPVVSGLAAWILFEERLTLLSGLGLALTIVGVAYVLWERNRQGELGEQWRTGILFAGLFVGTSAISIVFSKISLVSVPAWEASFLRTFWACVLLGTWAGISLNLLSWLKPLQNYRLAAIVILAGVIGAFLGTWLSMLALEYTLVSVASALNSTSPLFAVLMAYIFFKERLSARMTVGFIVAVSGLIIYFLQLN